MTEPNKRDNLKLDYTIICEDVRVEASNNLSLMGITHQLTVPQLPVTLIKMGIVNHWRMDSVAGDDGQFLTEIKILTPDRMHAVAISQPTAFTVPGGGGYSDNVTVFVNTTFHSSGEYLVQILIDSVLFAERVLPVVLIGESKPEQNEHVEYIN